MPETDVLYRVAKGDTLSAIASKFGLKSVATLVEYNNAHPKKKVDIAEGSDPPEGSLLLVPLSTGMRHEVVVGAKKIPLGGSATGAVKVGMFKVYVPSKRGGKLTLKHSDSGSVLQVLYPDSATHAVDAAGAEVPAAAEVTFDVPNDKFGWYYVLHVGNESPEVSAKFMQRGLSRDGTDDAAPPLVPYNFWYWSLSAYANPPVAHKDDPPWQPFSKWDKKFATKALEWEQDAVNGHCYIDPKDPKVEEKKKHYTEKTGQAPRMDDPDGKLSWTGHCHNSAPAAVAFKEPPEKSGDFSQDEMEHLGAEHFGNFGDTGTAWLLGNTWERSHPLHTQKPSADPKKFGETAATFYSKLIEWIMVKKHALMIDMRTSRVDAGHEQVWNQAMYLFEAELTEHPKAEGDDETKARDIFMTLRIHGNNDIFYRGQGSLGAPADIAGNDATPNGKGRDQELQFHLFFKGGDVETSNAKNEFVSCTILNNGDQLFSPRWLLEIKPLRRSANYNGDGNPSVTRERLKEIGVEPRDRYA